MCGCKGQHPSSAQAPGPGREVVSQSPPTDPHLKGVPTWDAQLRQLMEDLQQEAAQRELTTSPIGPPLGCWRASVEGDTDLEDGDVTLQEDGMGPSEPPQQSTGPLKWRRMLVTSSAHSQPD